MKKIDYTLGDATQVTFSDEDAVVDAVFDLHKSLGKKNGVAIATMTKRESTGISQAAPAVYDGEGNVTMPEVIGGRLIFTDRETWPA
jgi:hypothetical protein